MNILTVNPILSAAILGVAVAQVLKLLVKLLRYRKFDIELLFSAGGMPSSHSALVTALATATACTRGLSSPEFAIAAGIALIVMFDAAGVRRAAGEQAKVLNKMIKNWGHTTPELFGQELKELLGHTRLEVFTGAGVGIVIGFLV